MTTLSVVDYIKYALEALAISFVAKYMLGKKGNLRDILLLTLSITAAMIILDLFAPTVGSYTRQGTGFGLGLGMIHSGGGFGNLQGALGLQRTLTGKGHGQTGAAQAGGGFGNLQGALGLQRTLQGKGHGQTGGGFGNLQGALGLQRTLTGKGHGAQTGGCGSCGVMVGGGCGGCGVMVGGQAGGMDDPVALDYYKNNMIPTGKIDPKHAVYDTLISTEADDGAAVVEPMDDPVALDYYRNGMSPKENPEPKHAVYDTLISTEGVTVTSKGAEQVNVLQRFIDDKTALEYHNKEGFDGETTGERGLVFGSLPNAEQGSGKIVYLGDLITLRTGNGQWTLQDNYVTVSKPGALNNRLFKLRLNKSGKSGAKGLKPVKYRDTVQIVYNNETAQTVQLNHDGDLNVLKNQRDINFSLIKQGDVSTVEPVHFGDTVIISTNADTYLKVDPTNGHILTSASLSDATPFVIGAERGCGPLWRYK